MSEKTFQFTRLQDGNKQRLATLKDAIGMSAGRETWLFVSPHDDDLVIGAGLWMQAAVQAGVDVQVLVVTDGRMGYCTLEQRDNIADIRKAETYASFEILGVTREQVEYIGYPDGSLYNLQGRRKHRSHDDEVKPTAGYVGLCNEFVYHLRRTRPQRVFVPTAADLHPDHQIVNNELMISLFHASGAIWPELGDPLGEVPQVYELAIYCDFPQPPQLEVRTDDATFEKKLAGIAAYRSQLQIANLIENIRRAGRYEYLRELNFRFYSPNHHKVAFA